MSTAFCSALQEDRAFREQKRAELQSLGSKSETGKLAMKCMSLEECLRFVPLTVDMFKLDGGPDAYEQAMTALSSDKNRQMLRELPELELIVIEDTTTRVQKRIWVKDYRLTCASCGKTERDFAQAVKVARAAMEQGAKDGAQVVHHLESRLSQSVRLRRCARCQKARYCSAECQKAAWRAGHKSVCQSATVGSDSLASTA